MNTNENSAVIEQRENGYWAELNGIGKLFVTGPSVDLDRAKEFAEAFVLQVQIFTDPVKSLRFFQTTFAQLKHLVEGVTEEFPFEGIEGFSHGDYTYFIDRDRMTIGVRFGALDVFFGKDDRFFIEMITSWHPIKKVAVCSGVTLQTVIDILKNSPGSRTYQEPRVRQVYLSEKNLEYWKSVVLTE